MNADGTTRITFDSSVNANNAKVVTSQEFINFLNNQSDFKNGKLVGNTYYLQYDMPWYTGGININLNHIKNNSNQFIANTVTSSNYGLSLTWKWEQKDSHVITSDSNFNEFVFNGDISAKFVYLDLGLIYSSPRIFKFKTNKSDGICWYNEVN